jgi:short-subunit dehydrogenase
LRKYNVDVRVISPGYIRTEMTKKNDFPMPFLMSSSDAADIISTKLENTRNPNISFPWPMYYAIWFAGIVSRKVMRFILPLLPAKK